jgi:hypothetical protein
MPGDPKHLTLFHGIYCLGTAVQALSGTALNSRLHGFPSDMAYRWRTVALYPVRPCRRDEDSTVVEHTRPVAHTRSHACRRGLRLQRRRLGRWITTQSTESDSEDGSPWRCSGATESHAVTGRRATDPQALSRPALPASSRLAASSRQAGQ